MICNVEAPNTFLAILISCLGSYGVIMYLASQKRKEIGVRKVLGASTLQIILLLARQFILLVVIAVVIATPFVYLFSDYWLDDFSYRIDISPISIVIASLATLALVLFTVSHQSIKAALANPAVSLKEE
jgi:putative ABC transport system permease protein